MDRWWWVVGIIAAVILLPLVFPGRRGPKHYMWRSHQRVELADRIVESLDEELEEGTLSAGKLLRLEGKLYALWEAQKKEKPPAPEVMNQHRDAYAKLLEFSFLMVRDVRTTGGENLSQIQADQQAFLAEQDAYAKRVDQEHAKLYRDWGLSP